MISALRRRNELLTVTTFVDAIPHGASLLLLEGEAGIGKTTIWDAGLAYARKAKALQVAATRISQPETTMSYAALGDLFDGVSAQMLDRLPHPQRAALNVALLRTAATDAVHEPRAVALATLSVIRMLAAECPIVIGLDDIDCLDISSAHVIGFVLRRLSDEPVGVLATRRLGAGRSDVTEFEHAQPPDRVTRLEVGPLDSGALGAMLRDRLNADIPHSVTVKIHALAAGNPFYALEIARTIIRDGIPAPGAPFPVPDDAADIIRERVGSLAEPTIAALQVVAAAARPTVSLVRRAATDVDAGAALDEAERAGLVSIRAGRVSFTHPLFATAISANCSGPTSRSVHKRIAAAIADPEERSRHLALSASGPDASIASALDDAALRARRRGAAAAAAELASLAPEYTAEDDVPAYLRRSVTAAMFAFEAGDAARTHDLLETAIDAASPGPTRASIMIRICEVSWQDIALVERFALRALEEAGDDGDTAASAHVMLTWACVYRGELTRAAQHAEAGRAALSPQHGDPSTTADVLTADALTAFLTGREFRPLLDDAVAIQDRIGAADWALTGIVYSTARVVRGLIHLWAGDLASARRWLEDELSSYEALGRYVARDEVLFYLAQLECLSGDWKKAEAYADECLEIGEESGHLRGRGQNIVPRAWVAALRGDLASARRDALEGLGLSLRYGDLLAAAGNSGVLGFADLSADEPKVAVMHFRHVVGFLRRSATVEPRILPFVADAVEALVESGQLEEAEAIAQDDRLMGRESRHRAFPLAECRVNGLIAAARADLAGALETLQRGLDDDAPLTQPFELARTLLVKGEVERRAKHKAKARADLEEARDLFDGLGASLWAARARSELARVTSTATLGAGLSPTERALANLVAEGKTNREAAALMFVAVKTVEANLSRIYRKLGVRSRSELVRLLMAGSEGASEETRSGAADLPPSP